MINRQVEFVKPSDILSRMLLQISSQASLIEQQYGDYLLPSPQGYYKIGERLPCITPRSLYHTCTRDSFGNLVYTDITDMASVVDNVYDINANIVANRYVMMNKKSLLTTVPTIAARGMSVIQKVIDYEIACISPILNTHYCEAKILSEFIPEARDSIDLTVLLSITRYITAELHSFIGNDTWNYYYTKLSGIDLLVEKGPDHRVCEWYLMKYGKNHEP